MNLISTSFLLMHEIGKFQQIHKQLPSLPLCKYCTIQCHLHALVPRGLIPAVHTICSLVLPMIVTWAKKQEKYVYTPLVPLTDNLLKLHMHGTAVKLHNFATIKAIVWHANHSRKVSGKVAKW